MIKEAKIQTPVRLPVKTRNQIDEYIKFNPSMKLPDVIEMAVGKMMESKSDKQFRKLYKVAKKATLALYAKRDHEGLSGQEGNILDCLHNLTEYIENFETETDDLDQ